MKIKEISVYIPACVLDSSFNRKIRGSIRLMNYDEDTVTMGVASSLEIESIKENGVKKITFLSPYTPFFERTASSLLATVLDVEDVRAVDVTGDYNTLIDVLSDAEEGELVVASDAKRYPVNSTEFYGTGHGAVAVFMDTDGEIEVAGALSFRRDTLVEWRNLNEVENHTSESKATLTFLKPHFSRVVEGVLKKTSIKRDKVWKVYLALRDQRSAVSILKSLGFNDEQIWKSQIQGKTGFTGIAHPILEVVSMLEKENPRDAFILLLTVGSGVGALLLHTGDNPMAVVKKGTEDNLKRTVSFSSDTIYKILGYLPYEKVQPFSPHTLYHRDIEQCVKLKAQKCKKCGAVNYPWRFICYNCKAIESFELVPLSRRGKIYTFTRDYLNPGPVQPIVMGVADLEDGGRFYGQMTDVKPEEVKVGMEVELVFRRLHEGGDFVNYFWKLKPRR